MRGEEAGMMQRGEQCCACGCLCRHRGSGASKGPGRSVRENTLLSFQKAAASMCDLIEFDVHVTGDGEARRSRVHASLKVLVSGFLGLEKLHLQVACSHVSLMHAC